VLIRRAVADHGARLRNIPSPRRDALNHRGDYLLWRRAAGVNWRWWWQFTFAAIRRSSECARHEGTKEYAEIGAALRASLPYAFVPSPSNLLSNVATLILHKASSTRPGDSITNDGRYASALIKYDARPRIRTPRFLGSR